MIGEFLQKLKVNKSLGNNEAVNADGGYAIAKEVTDKFISYLGDNTLGIAAKATKYILPDGVGNGIKIPIDIGTDWTNGLAYVIGEGQNKTAATPQLSYYEDELCKIVCLIPVTDEVLQDTKNLGEFVLKTSTAAITRKLEYMMINNTSTDKVQGVLGNADIIYVNTALAGSMTKANYRDIHKQLHPFANKAEWLLNNKDHEDLDTVFADTDIVIWAEDNTSLFSHKVQKCPFEFPEVEGGKINAILADWSKYILVMKNLKIKVSDQVNFKNDETIFRVELRVCGKVISAKTQLDDKYISNFVVGYSTDVEVESSGSSKSTDSSEGDN